VPLERGAAALVSSAKAPCVAPAIQISPARIGRSLPCRHSRRSTLLRAAEKVPMIGGADAAVMAGESLDNTGEIHERIPFLCRRRSRSTGLALTPTVGDGNFSF
jgi:hypothetical protein